MDFGYTQNPNLKVNHKSELYPSEIACTIFIVSPIKRHDRAPTCPCGEKK